MHLIDIHKNTRSKYFFENKNGKEIRLVDSGISSDGKMLARILHSYDNPSIFSAGKTVLLVSDISDPTKNTLELSDQEIAKCKPVDIHFPLVAFNKQGTKVIVHNNKEYEIFDLCDEVEHKQKGEKILVDYFRQRGVCKNLLARNVA